MEEFVKYITSLEQRLAALETAQAKEAEQEAEIAALRAMVVALEARIVELESRPAVVETETEPEVEVEFEWGDETEEETAEEPVEETVEESVEEPMEEPEPEKPAAAFSTAIGAPVDDIRKAISLGDRFLFVRELFDGRGEKMQIVLDKLQECHTIEEAHAYLDEHFNWDKENKTYLLFENVLKRRFN